MEKRGKTFKMPYTYCIKRRIRKMYRRIKNIKVVTYYWQFFNCNLRFNAMIYIYLFIDEQLSRFIINY